MTARRALAALLWLAIAATPPVAAQGLVLSGLGGGELQETSLDRGATIVVVWASWSPRCRDIGERVNELEAAWGGRARVLTVNFQEESGAAREFRDRQELRAPVFLDPEAAFSKKHGVTSLPYLLVFRDGETLFSGKLPSDPERTLKRLLS